uniref:PDZ domain-containing protein n=1 Tax=Noctiluca scintillans TaxID=2966 RepID=A0A7S1F3K2_NOCSC
MAGCRESSGSATPALPWLEDDAGGLTILDTFHDGSSAELRRTGAMTPGTAAARVRSCPTQREPLHRLSCRNTQDEVQEKFAEEDLRWDERRQQTGLAGRIVIYDKDESPQTDIALRDGANGRIVVAALRWNGRAMRAGVTTKDVLMSIDGKKEFCGLTAMQVHASLKPSVTLVFLGFVGKLTTEVRLTHKTDVVCGLSMRSQVTPEQWGGAEVVDEVVFQPVPIVCPRQVISTGSADSGKTARHSHI